MITFIQIKRYKLFFGLIMTIKNILIANNLQLNNNST